jgi:hypothetical protein
MHVPCKWRVAVALVPALVAMALGAAPASAAQVTIGEELDDSAYPDGYDYLLTWSNGRWVQSSRGGLGTLATDTNAANPISTNGLTLLKTICFKGTGALQGRHCFKKFKGIGDNDPNYNYRLWWVTGSMAATKGHRLLAVRDGFNTSSSNGAYLADWRPIQTINAGECFQTSVGMSLGAYGISASISTSFTVCPEKFGPSFIGDKLFRFRWDGDRGAGNYVGAGGGALYAIPAGTNPKFDLGVQVTYTQ